MKTITFTKKETRIIDSGECLEFERFGLPMFAQADECGDFETPNGTRYWIGFYNPNECTMKINYK